MIFPQQHIVCSTTAVFANPDMLIWGRGPSEGGHNGATEIELGRDMYRRAGIYLVPVSSTIVVKFPCWTYPEE